MSFASFSLDQKLLKVTTEIAYLNPTAIQQQAIPLILAKHDVMARARTGTGKTAAFVLPILQRLIDQKQNEGSTRVLVLTPTRELTQQVHQSFKELGKHTHLVFAAAYGGVSVKGQIDKMQKGVDVLVATPGRLLDLLSRETFTLETLQVLVFDEADRMLDLGFKDEINRILTLVPKKRQTLLFSATFDDAIYKMSKSILTDVKKVEIDEKNSIANDIKQVVYTVDQERKREFISYFIGSQNWHQVLIFTRTKKSADSLAIEMKKDGIKAQSLHGDKSQGARDKALEEFKDGRIRALVATDVAARGIDISDLEYVINYELPYQAEDYIHRIGRTARAGKSGVAVSLLTLDEKWLLTAIEELLDQHLLEQWYPGYEPKLSLVESSVSSKDSRTSKKTARNKALSGKAYGNKKKASRNRNRSR